MKLKLTLFAIITCALTSIYAQANLNDYKYVIVPNKFDFLNEENKYRLNELTQFLFEKNGFTAILASEQMPNDLVDNGCLALRSDVIEENSLFKTKLKIVLKDCRGTVVYTSKLGQSKEKLFKTAYNLALRDAFTSFDTVTYKYVEGSNTMAPTKVNADVSQSKNYKAKTSQQETKKVKDDTTNADIKYDVLYAQKIENGFQLVDNSPKVVMILIATPRANTFIVKDENATVYKEDELWYISKIKDNKTITEVLKIKF